MSIKDDDAAAAAVATHKRISLADIEDAITHQYSIGGADLVLKVLGDVPTPAALYRLMICVLVTRNGFTVIGKSAPLSAENFNPELGRKFAYEDAIRQLWPLMAFSELDRRSGGT